MRWLCEDIGRIVRRDEVIVIREGGHNLVVRVVDLTVLQATLLLIHMHFHICSILVALLTTQAW